MMSEAVTCTLPGAVPYCCSVVKMWLLRGESWEVGVRESLGGERRGWEEGGGKWNGGENGFGESSVRDGGAVLMCMCVAG